MNDLQTYFDKNTGRVIHKWQHYFEIYDCHFSKYRNKELVIVEIGVFQGGSLQMWKNYFGPKARIYGIDVDPECKKFEEESITIFIGSQSDRTFLNKLKQEIPPIDILIDDGGHTMNQLRSSFDELFMHVKEDGIYTLEDLHTCYKINYGGGYKRRGSFIEYSKSFIDDLHAWHSSSLKINKFTKSIYSLHFYDSMLIIEKRVMKPPVSLSSGTQICNPFAARKRMPMKKIGRKAYRVLNTVLSVFRFPSIPKI